MVHFLGLYSNEYSVISLGQLYQLNDPRVNDVIVEGDPLPVPENVILTRSKAQKMGETFTRIPAPAKIIKLFLRELIVGQYNAADAVKDAAAASTDSAGQDEWEDLDPEIEVTPLEGTMPLEDLLKYVNKGDIDDIDGEELFDLDNPRSSSTVLNRRTWAGSDNATQGMIASWIKNVVQSDIGGFKANVYPSLTAEENACIESLLK